MFEIIIQFLIGVLTPIILIGGIIAGLFVWLWNKVF